MGFYLNHNNYRHIYYKSTTHPLFDIVFQFGESEIPDVESPVARIQQFDIFKYKYETKFEKGRYQTIKTIFEPDKMREYKLNLRVYTGHYSANQELKRYIDNTRTTLSNSRYKYWSILNILEYWRSVFARDYNSRKPGRLYYVTKNIRGEKIYNYLEGYFTESNIVKTDPLGDWADVELTFLDLNGGWVDKIGEVEDLYYAWSGLKVGDVKKGMPCKYHITTGDTGFFEFGFDGSTYPYRVEVKNGVTINQSTGNIVATSAAIVNHRNILEPLIPTADEIYVRCDIEGSLEVYQYTPWPMVATDKIKIGG